MHRALPGLNRGSHCVWAGLPNERTTMLPSVCYERTSLNAWMRLEALKHDVPELCECRASWIGPYVCPPRGSVVADGVEAADWAALSSLPHTGHGVVNGRVGQSPALVAALCCMGMARRSKRAADACVPNTHTLLLSPPKVCVLPCPFACALGQCVAHEAATRMRVTAMRVACHDACGTVGVHCVPRQQHQQETYPIPSSAPCSARGT